MISGRGASPRQLASSFGFTGEHLRPQQQVRADQNEDSQ